MRMAFGRSAGVWFACVTIGLSGVAAPDDPFYLGEGSWGQPYADQWYLAHAGFDPEDALWEEVRNEGADVVVAVVDTGLDWNHLDFAWRNIWRNPGETPGNGIDDDGNGYVDDSIGWDFTGKHNKPWDYDGHGTLVAGIIAAESSNGIGITGINPRARLMILKAMNDFGHGRATFVAEAVAYAVDNGARIVNVSIAGPTVTEVERRAFAYARSHGVLIVVAAGNEGESLDAYGPAADPDVLTVGASDPADARAAFSNWGPQVDIAAPGVDILSLRARRTDTMRGIPDYPYEAGSAYVGADKRYYRASGTSFAAPIVSGVASLVLSKRPELDGEALRRILLHSARDIDLPGVDGFSGYGLVDAGAAIEADPAFYIDAHIEGVSVVRADSGPLASIRGTADADRLAAVRLELGRGGEPSEWKVVGRRDSAVVEGELGRVPAIEFAGAKLWTLRVVVEHANGRTREARFRLNLN